MVRKSTHGGRRAGSGNKPGVRLKENPKKQIGLRLDQAVIELIDENAVDGVTKTEVVESAIIEKYRKPVDK